MTTNITPGPFSTTLRNVLLDILAIEGGLTPGSEQSNFLVEQCEKDPLGILADGTPLSKHLRLAFLMEHHLNETKKARDVATDTADLMRDEFLRIRAIVGNVESPYGEEIDGLCERAISTIHQHVPVIVQRDVAEDDRDFLRMIVYKLEDYINASAATDCPSMLNDVKELLADPRLDAIKRKLPNVIPAKYLNVQDVTVEVLKDFVREVRAFFYMQHLNAEILGGLGRGQTFYAYAGLLLSPHKTPDVVTDGPLAGAEVVPFPKGDELFGA